MRRSFFSVRSAGAAFAIGAALALTPALAFAEGTPTVVPTPQSMEVGSGSVSLADGVNVVDDGADEDAVAALEEVLADAGVTVSDAAKTTIYLGETDDAAQTAAATELSLDASDLGAEGYVLGASSETGTIVLNGADGDGSFYAVQTLAQLIDDSSVPDVSITDEPEMAHRGVIEGFYAGDGAGWTWEDRQNQLEYYGETKLNTYIYAPKDDPYHRANWRDPYPAEQLAKMEKLVQIADENKVDFVFAISPGNTIDLESESDFEALVSKCETMYKLGVRHFAIFFDDISLTGSDPGTQQAELLNRFQTEFLDEKGDCSPLVTVPTKYDSLAMTNTPEEGSSFNEYSNHFAETLDDRIEVLYTGPAVVPEGIPAENVDLVKELYGDRLGIWWNYNCNDFLRNKLCLGPMYGLDNELGEKTDYFVSNPMGWAELNKVSEATAADYSWNTDVYDADASLEAAVPYVYGDGELGQAMMVFADHSTRMVGGSNSSGRADAPETRALMDTVLKKAAAVDDLADDADVAALRAEFDAMVEAGNYLAEHSAEVDSTNTGGTHSPVANFQKLTSVGEADKVALDLLIAKVEQNEEQVQSLTTQLNSLKSSLSSGKVLSEQCGVKFVDDVLSYEIEPTAGFSVSSTFVKPGQEIQLTNESSLSAATYEWSFPGAVPGTSSDEAPTISYAHEGRYTITLTVSNKFGEDVATIENVVTVSEDAPAETTNIALGKTATASGQTGASESADKAVDGLTSTKWCTTGYTQWLQVDLGSTSTITGYSLANAAVGGEGASLNTYAWHVEVSDDGSAWTEVSRVSGNTENQPVVSLPAVQARYVRLTVDKPTNGADSAARIFEFEVYGTQDEVTMPDSYTAPDWTALQTALSGCADLDESVYTAESWKPFAEALAAAQALLDGNYATQDEVNAAATALTEAKDALVVAPVVKDDLQASVDAAGKLEAGDYTAESWAAFQEALEAARAVLADEDATQAEVDAARAALAAAAEGLAEAEPEPGPEPEAKATEMYRLYNKWTGEHFYTASEKERDVLTVVGWTFEGVGWYAPEQGDEVMRLYNPFVDGGDHHYTLDEHEYEALQELGWKGEGLGWYSAEKDAEGAVPLYRQYNPYAETGTHNYTPDENENDTLESLGWVAEGIAWYGVTPADK